uniref:Zn(2)-C6 fungal-type domain-containing protein n=1 Tax=Kalmanozyma brasiliensis (strain GHG001) TaxID=1365824 RepID=V5ECW2_KALBG
MPRASRSNKKDKELTESKESPARRERSLRACTRCRQRKQKCDNTLPHCSNCVKGGVACEAFPINSVSRDNLLQIYDLLQESTRRNRVLEKELSLARVVVPDFLAVFSAFIAKQAPSSATTTATLLSAGTEPDIWATIRALEECFPAVSPVIIQAAEQLDQDVSLTRLFDIAAVPIRDLRPLLNGTATCSEESLRHSLVEPSLSLEELQSMISTASDMTRIAATLLWALLALAQHRGEELMRLDTALTCFVQSWQAKASALTGFLDVQDAVALSFCRAYEWVHLRKSMTFMLNEFQQFGTEADSASGIRAETAIMTGQLLVIVTTTSGFQNVGAIAASNDFTGFLASLHVEQKRLEYMALHLFISPIAAMTDAQHEEAIWNLLSSIKSLSEANTQGFDSFGVSHYAAGSSQRVLMRNKLGTQLYGMFPRMLFMHCPNERRNWRWLRNALPLAATALSCHHAAWMQYSWLGDHVLDVLTFSDLLAAFAWILQQCRAQTDMRDDVSNHLGIAIELGDRFAHRWPQYNETIHRTMRDLHALQESPLSASGLSTPWSAASVATALTESSCVLRTPQAQEMPQPAARPHTPPQEATHPHHYFQPDLRQLYQQQGPPSHDSRYSQPDVKGAHVPEGWGSVPLQPIQADWSSRGDAGLALNSIAASGGGVGQQLPFVDIGTVQRKEEASMDAHTIDTPWSMAQRPFAALRALPPLNTGTMPQQHQQQPAPTTATSSLFYLDERATDAKP